MPDYWRFEVRLLEPAADLWRRFLLRKDGTFEDLHCAIQDACGWEYCHLYSFITPRDRKTIACIPNEDAFDPEPDAADVTLASYFGGRRGRKKCTYWYDFGDDWMHAVTMEHVEKHEQQFERRLLGGAGTFPPEDSGGIGLGYPRSVAAVTGKGWVGRYGSEADRQEHLGWLGGWRPDLFKLAKTKVSFDF